MEFKNLALAIQQLLLRSGHTVLPGMGVLQLHYRPARLHRQEGRMVPPSEIPEFEPVSEDTLSSPDRALLADYQKVSGIPQEDLARKDLLEQFRLVKEALDEGQTVFLPEVGTFQSGKEGLTFEPDSFNYYLEVFGLGAVTARPVLRRTPEEAARVAQEERSKILVRPQVVAQRTWKDRLFLPGLAALLILSIAGCIWLIFSPDQDPALQESVMVDPSMMPEQEEDSATPSPGDVTEDFLEDPEAEMPLSEPLDSDEDRATTPLPEISGVRIAVGHFGNPENVAGIMERLTKAGFVPGSEPARGSLTRVFITVDPRVQSPQEALAVIKRDFEPTAWILDK